MPQWRTDLNNLAQEFGVAYRFCNKQRYKGTCKIEIHIGGRLIDVGLGKTPAKAKGDAARRGFEWLRMADEQDLRRAQAHARGHHLSEEERRSEQAVLRALLNCARAWPMWMANVRSATEKEYSLGIDIIVEAHDLGALFLQVKASRRSALQFLDRGRRRSMIAILVVTGQEEMPVLFSRALDVLEKLRTAIGRRRER